MTDIHDAISAWHDGDDPRPLHEYLGMTWAQYGHWFQYGELPEGSPYSDSDKIKVTNDPQADTYDRNLHREPS